MHPLGLRSGCCLRFGLGVVQRRGSGGAVALTGPAPVRPSLDDDVVDVGFHLGSLRTCRPGRAAVMQATLSESPSRLPEVMRHVSGLTSAQINDFADLLKQIELPHVIRASQVVADRVGFLTALEQLLFDPGSRDEFLEKKQLHPLVEAHPWMFGAEWSIAASEVTLASAFARHLAALRPDDASAGHLSSSARRIDMLLTAGVKDDRRHRRLVVELKRANTVLDREHPISSRTTHGCSRPTTSSPATGWPARRSRSVWSTT